MVENIELFNEKKDCCGCGACLNICPKNAISMIEDEYGFVYPHIDQDKCVKCGMCNRVCAYQNGSELNKSEAVYVASNKDQKQKSISASGGAFSALATCILEKNGIIYGAAYVFENDKLEVRHIGITELTDLYKIQGSKYVQSNIAYIYKEVKEVLNTGRLVLFSGTPCQIGALLSFLGKKYDNLYTVDIVCHGVPNQKMFRDYISLIENNKFIIKDFNFRDKTKGWADFSIKYFAEKGNTVFNKNIHCRLSSFYEYFLQAKIYRENCYSCKYACEKRVSDITIGDFWGIEKQHPEIFSNQNWKNGLYTGISCVLANTNKGVDLVLESSMELVDSDYFKASNGNGQLRTPSHYENERDVILELYKNSGYIAVDEKFNRELGKKRVYYKLKACIPLEVKRALKNIH